MCAEEAPLLTVGNPYGRGWGRAQVGTIKKGNRNKEAK